MWFFRLTPARPFKRAAWRLHLFRYGQPYRAETSGGNCIDESKVAPLVSLFECTIPTKVVRHPSDRRQPDLTGISTFCLDSSRRGCLMNAAALPQYPTPAHVAMGNPAPITTCARGTANAESLTSVCPFFFLRASKAPSQAVLSLTVQAL